MGVVYEAFDEERRAPVALKTLSRFDGDALARFKREFRALQGLTHPNLVALDELFFEDDQWFFTMELLDGADFVTHVTGRGGGVPFESTVRESVGKLAARSAAPTMDGGQAGPTFDEPRLRDGLRQLLEGLSALHAVDKIHRDVKPSNVLVTRAGRVVLLDFGLVTAASTEDRSTGGAILGTPAYMAPEQAASRELGPAADVYAVGVMLYEVLTGRLPMEGTQLQILLEKQRREAEHPASLVAGLPEDLSALCVKMLRFDPALRPDASGALRALSPRRAHGAALPRTSTEAPIFVGREGELSELRAMYEVTRGGRLATALVCGTSGIGKSYLVRRFTGELLAEHPEAMVLEGRCYERETVPYKTLDGIVDALSRRLSRMSATEVDAVLPRRSGALAQIFPVMLGVPQVAREHQGFALAVEPHELRRRAFVVLRDLITRMAMKRPIVLVIDDIQWADDDGLRALADILRPPDAPPILLLGTVRAAPDEDAGLQRVLAVLPGGTRLIPLANLEPEEARTLAVAFLRRNDADDADPEIIASEAGGHPLFVEELARHVALGGRARSDVSLDDAICDRIAQLEGPTRQLAEIVAAAGKPVPQEVVAAAARLDPAEFHRRTATLRVSNVVRTGGARQADAIEPYHDRVREAVLARLEPGRKQALHEALALAFETSSTRVDPEALATHWHEAGNDGRAATWAIEAATLATRTFAFERAAEWYQLALAWLPEGHAERRTIQVRIGDALANAGRGVVAARHFAAAADGAAPMQALDLRRRAAEELLSAGRFDEGDEMLRSVLADVGIDLPRTPIGALLGLVFFRFLLLLRGLRFRERSEDHVPAHALTRLEACNGVGRILAMVDTIRGAYFQTRALWVALSVGEPNRVAHSLAAEAVYIATGGHARRSARLLDEAHALAQRTGSAKVQALVEAARGFGNFVLGRFEIARRHSDHSAALLRDCPGAWWELRTAQLCAIWAVGWMGDLNELARRVEEGVREARGRGDIYAGTTLRTGLPNLMWLRAGDTVSARAAVVEAMEQWTQRGYHAQHYWCLLALTRIDLYEGDAHAAHQRVAGEWSQIVRALIPQVRVMGAEALHLRACTRLALGTREKGTTRVKLIRAAERDARTLRRMRWDVASAFAHLIHAGVAALRGDRDRAATSLALARDGCAALDMRLHAASAGWHLGRLRGGDEGRVLVTTAEAWLAAHGVADCGSMTAMIAPGFER
jgi:hypothetical protein